MSVSPSTSPSVSPSVSPSASPSTSMSASQSASASAATTPTYDSTSSQKHSSSATYLEWSHVLGGGSNRIVIITIAMRVVTATSVTFNGVNCTFLTQQKPGGDVNSELWYILEADLPAAGTYTVRVNGSSSQQWVAGAISYSDVSSLGTPNGANGSGTAASVTIVSEVDDVVVDCCSLQSANATLAPHTSQVERWDKATSVGRGGGSTETATTTSTVMSWSHNSDIWAITGVALKT